MNPVKQNQRVETIDWELLTNSMHQKGYATIPGLLSAEECDALIKSYDDASLYRKTVDHGTLPVRVGRV